MKQRVTGLKEKTLSRNRKSSVADVVGLFSAALLLCIDLFRHANGPAAQKRRMLLALVITTAFAFVAWLARGVDGGGALAGSSIAFVLASHDLRMFWVLLLVFAVTLLATRAGKSRKEQLHTAEASRGRSAAQVMANLGVAALIVSLGPQTWPLLALAALAEAAADTSSSEIGMAFSGRTLLLTTWKPVEPGVDGGVSLKGTLAAILAASVIATAAVSMQLVPIHQGLLVVLAGILGSLVDSLFGALMERRGLLSNDLVNLLSTAAAVGLAWIAL
ncbi:MAG TPA: DUF92 domain-containing protein [Candidatus Angelobacter sp.]|nr:DUF92 domain-containing protein [Candidatus Angelobacter sp.]